ncbi:MAG: amidase domain-containing protein [Firmicutes bacterium]|nr:amidase domain-containing protein [[Eubacterium] siraeum]MCM1487978.1 amidase domain-containing protein [Bacillota bacterium]
MKHFKRLAAACLAVMIGASLPAYAEESKISTAFDVDISLDLTLKEYFGKREDDFDLNGQVSAQSVNNTQQHGEITTEEMRPMLISKMEEKMAITVVSADTSYSVCNMRTEGSTAYLDVYEWTYVDYTGTSGLVDTMGYGVEHEMVFEKTEAGYSLVSDAYDEGPLTGMSSSLSVEKFAELINADYSVQASSENEYEEVQPYSNERTVSGYNPSKAIGYANKWVDPTANGTDNDKYYNTGDYFKNGNLDCTNYVSQCLYAGGVPQNNTGNINTGWWYKDVKNYSGSWITAPTNYNYFSASNTAYRNISSSSYIIPGNPVYYDWNSDNSINHATICVGYNSSGVPIVNSHSHDYYHAPWNYDNSNTKYSTIKITDDDILGSTSGAAELQYRGTYYARLDNSSDTDCFSFTAPSTGTYTFKTTGSTDTYGKLCSSTGASLAADDNSGDNSNFSISYKLDKGRTYYIYVSSLRPVQGFYGMLVS